ncbi:hypothetical protein ACWGJ6_24860 [Streptomyces canus]
MLGGFLPSDAGAPDYWADSFISLISPDEIVNLPPDRMLRYWARPDIQRLPAPD